MAKKRRRRWGGCFSRPERNAENVGDRGRIDDDRVTVTTARSAIEIAADVYAAVAVAVVPNLRFLCVLCVCVVVACPSAKHPSVLCELQLEPRKTRDTRTDDLESRGQ